MKITRWFLILVFVGSVRAQEVPFLSESDYTWLVNEISGDAAYEHLRYLTQFHKPRGGAPGLMKVAEYVEQKAREAGLEDVRLIKQKSNTTPWSSQYGEVWLTRPSVKLIASTQQTQLHLADFSRTTHVAGDLVNVGRGTREADYEGKKVKGKIVLAYGPVGTVMNEAVWKRGGLGILYYPDPAVPDYPANALSHPDQVHWTSIPFQSSDEEKKPGTFAFSLSARQGVELSNLLNSGKPVGVKVDIESEFGEEKWQVMVEGFIKGREIINQDIVLTAHLQEEKFSANDDGSGCANVLEIARALKRLIDQGKIERPRRNIRFWWVTEISSERQFFADHPEAYRSMLANINQDMVGANQGQDLLRVQNMTQVPFSRFHFLNDVAERVMEFTMESNKGNLAVLQAGNAFPYPRPILSHLGTRHRFNAEIIPFHNNTDHMTFNEAPIGVPAITFTNWPDNYIHSSDDDLWNIDRTQLQRNAFTVAAIGYVLAQAGSRNFNAIASEVAGKAVKRIGEDFRLALGWLTNSRERFNTAFHQIDEAYKREHRDLASLGKVAETEQDRSRIDALMLHLGLARQGFLTILMQNYLLLYGEDPPTEKKSEVEQELEKMIPRLSAGAAEFLERRNRVQSVANLHGLMAFEITNFIDGQRSGLEIYHAVSAEARRAGKHYYGEVSPEMVKAYLQNLKKAELVAF